MWTWEPWIVGMTMLRAGRGIDNCCGNRVATMVAQWTLSGRSVDATVDATVDARKTQGFVMFT